QRARQDRLDRGPARRHPRRVPPPRRRGGRRARRAQPAERGTQRRDLPARRGGLMGAILLSLGASLSWGVADYLGGTQTRRHPLLTVILFSQGAGLLAVVLVLAVRGEAPPPSADLVPAVLVGLIGLAALACFYRALAVGTISIVAPIAATSAIVPV